MEMPLQILVTAIILMVAAVLVIVFFGDQLFKFTGITNEETMCINEFVTICQSSGKPPVDWTVPKYRDSKTGERVSCANIMSPRGGCQCTEDKTKKIFVSNCPANK